MSFDKRYPKAKDARRRLHRYHDSRDFDRECRCHGDCPYCESNRTVASKRRKQSADAAMKEEG